MRKIFRVLIRLLLLLPFVFIDLPGFAEDNLLKNPSFEEVDASGVPLEWHYSNYQQNTNITRFSTALENPHSGKRSCYISNIERNHSVIEQKVAVDELSLYRLSGWIRTSNIGEEYNGAGISVNDKWEVAGEARGTHPDWEYAEMYVAAGWKIKSLTVKLNIGIFTSENTGEAWFDDISMTKIDYLPPNVLLSIVDPYSRSIEPKDVIIWTNEDILHPVVTLDGIPLVLLIACTMIMVAAVLYSVYLRMIKTGDKPITKNIASS